jgi:hypothetical protein
MPSVTVKWYTSDTPAPASIGFFGVYWQDPVDTNTYYKVGSGQKNIPENTGSNLFVTADLVCSALDVTKKYSLLVGNSGYLYSIGVDGDGLTRATNNYPNTITPGTMTDRPLMWFAWGDLSCGYTSGTLNREPGIAIRGPKAQYFVEPSYWPTPWPWPVVVADPPWIDDPVTKPGDWPTDEPAWWPPDWTWDVPWDYRLRTERLGFQYLDAQVGW